MIMVESGKGFEGEYEDIVQVVAGEPGRGRELGEDKGRQEGVGGVLQNADVRDEGHAFLLAVQKRHPLGSGLPGRI